MGFSKCHFHTWEILCTTSSFSRETILQSWSPDEAISHCRLSAFSHTHIRNPTSCLPFFVSQVSVAPESLQASCSRLFLWDQSSHSLLQRSVSPAASSSLSSAVFKDTGRFNNAYSYRFDFLNLMPQKRKHPSCVAGHGLCGLRGGTGLAAHVMVLL